MLALPHPRDRADWPFLKGYRAAEEFRSQRIGPVNPYRARSISWWAWEEGYSYWRTEKNERLVG